MILEKIKKPNDIHKVSLEDFPRLAEEIRSFLIQSVSETGGHLASNLGVVELTLALLNVRDFPQDKLIWDVGHQAYTHKLLCGRKAGFDDLRQFGGMSGDLAGFSILMSELIMLPAYVFVSKAVNI